MRAKPRRTSSSKSSSKRSGKRSLGSRAKKAVKSLRSGAKKAKRTTVGIAKNVERSAKATRDIADTVAVVAHAVTSPKKGSRSSKRGTKDDA